MNINFSFSFIYFELLAAHCFAYHFHLPLSYSFFCCCCCSCQIFSVRILIYICLFHFTFSVVAFLSNTNALSACNGLRVKFAIHMDVYHQPQENCYNKIFSFQERDAKTWHEYVIVLLKCIKNEILFVNLSNFFSFFFLAR